MKKNINVEVNSIRLEENTETPIMLLLDPNSQKVLPIWIGTIEAVSIAYAQEGIKHPRPQTHDLIIDIIESLNGNIDEVVISDLHDNTYFAEIIILGGSVAEAINNNYFDDLLKTVSKYCIKFYKDSPPIRMTKLGEDASILGASIIAQN